MVAPTNSQPLKTDASPAVCILYGFCEGPRIGRRFESELGRAGFSVEPDVSRADIVVAHSGGCFLVSDSLPARQVVMIGLTHWPGKPIVWSLIEKSWNDFRFQRGARNLRGWLHKFAWNLIYFWNMPNNLRMLKARKRGEFWQAKHLTLIRNYEDSFCTPDVASLPFDRTPTIVELPGQHDDCWLRPENYVDIIKSEYDKRLLAQTGK